MKDMLQKKFMPLMENLAQEHDLGHYLIQMQKGVDTLEKNPNPQTYALAKGIYASASKVYELKKEKDKREEDLKALRAKSAQAQEESYARKRKFSELVTRQKQQLERQQQELQRLRNAQPHFSQQGEVAVTAGASKLLEEAEKKGPWAKAAFIASMRDGQKKHVPYHERTQTAEWVADKWQKLVNQHGVSNPSDLTWAGIGPYPEDPNYPESDRRALQRAQEPSFDPFDQRNWSV